MRQRENEKPDLFAARAKDVAEQAAPLATRLRPRTIAEVVGQAHVIGPGKPLRRMIDEDRVSSLILYGAPGTGKTTIARLIAAHSKAHFEPLNAVTSGVADLRRVIDAARERLGLYGRKTILFIDEIHRFNKAQQDLLLPAVEDGVVVFLGATTENPFFEVNAPLISRSRVIKLQPLGPDDLKTLARRAVSDVERALGKLRPALDEEALEELVVFSGGDARNLLNTLEAAVNATTPDMDGARRITREAIAEAAGRPPLVYDKTGDNHYDTISAFIKSLRGSDPDAALHWLARMLEAGEDPQFIARRLVIHASEDVGLADPMALVVATAAAAAVDRVGLPEGRLALAEAAIYVAMAPKSNSVYLAISTAMEDVAAGKRPPVPAHLRDSSYPGATRLGHGSGYLYPHDYPGHYVPQEYLPDPLVGTEYYRPSQEGREAKLVKKTGRSNTNPRSRPPTDR